MPDLNALKAAWPPSGTLEQKLAHVNALMTEGPTIDIPLPAIRERLAPRMAHLETFAMMARTRDLRRRLHMAEPVSQSIVSVIYLLQLLSSAEKVVGQHKLPVLKGLLADLVRDEASGISSEDVDGILAMSKSSVPWWQRHGFSQPGVDIYDAIAAGVS
jgi:hypothetical protein